MSYKIEYSPHKNTFYPSKQRKERSFAVVTLLMLVLVVLVCGTAIHLQEIADYYFACLDDFAVQIKEGTSIGRAIAVSCAQIYENVKAL